MLVHLIKILKSPFLPTVSGLARLLDMLNGFKKVRNKHLRVLGSWEVSQVLHGFMFGSYVSLLVKESAGEQAIYRGSCRRWPETWRECCSSLYKVSRRCHAS